MWPWSSTCEPCPARAHCSALVPYYFAFMLYSVPLFTWGIYPALLPYPTCCPDLLCIGVTLRLIPCLLSSFAVNPPVSIQCSAVVLEYLASLLCSAVSLHYHGPLYYLSALLCSAVLLENPTVLYCFTTLLCSALLLKYPALLRVLLEYPALCLLCPPPPTRTVPLYCSNLATCSRGH